MLSVAILTFIASFLLIIACVFIATTVKESPAAQLRLRLRSMARETRGKSALPEDLRLDIIREIPPFERFISHIPFLRNTEKLLDQAGLKISPSRFLFMVAAISLACFIAIFILRGNYILALVVAVAALIAPYIYLYYRKSQRADKFTEQLPDTLTTIARSLRAGHSLNSAVELIGQEMPDPTSEFFKTAYEQQKLGLPVTDSLTNIAERVESLDFRFFITVVTINNEVGGNLAEVLDKLAATIRDRLKIRRQVRVYTAQGRLSGYLLAALPIITFIVFSFIMPGYEDALIKSKQGQIILAAAFAAQIIGFLFIRKIINIRI
ncbi:MAG: type II secretion system F family protein [Geobacteraceae bacterium]